MSVREEVRDTAAPVDLTSDPKRDRESRGRHRVETHRDVGACGERNDTIGGSGTRAAPAGEDPVLRRLCGQRDARPVGDIGVAYGSAMMPAGGDDTLPEP